MAGASDDEDGWGAFEGGMVTAAPAVEARPALAASPADADAIAPPPAIAGGGDADAGDESDGFGDFLGPEAAATAATVDDTLIARLAGVAVGGEGGEGGGGASSSPAPRPPSAAPAAVAVADLLPRGAALPEDLFAEPVVAVEEEEEEEEEKACGGDDDAGSSLNADDPPLDALVVDATARDAFTFSSSPPPASDGGGWAAFAGPPATRDGAERAGAASASPDDAAPASSPPDDEGSDWDAFAGAEGVAVAVEAAPPPPPTPPPPFFTYPLLWTALLDAAAAELETAADRWRALAVAAGPADAAAHPRVARYLMELAHVRAAALAVEAAVEEEGVSGGGGDAGVARALDRARAAWDADEALASAIAAATAAWGGEAAAWRLLSRPAHGAAAADAPRCRLTLLPGVDGDADVEAVDGDGLALGPVARLWRARVLAARG